MMKLFVNAGKRINTAWENKMLSLLILDSDITANSGRLQVQSNLSSDVQEEHIPSCVGPAVGSLCISQAHLEGYEFRTRCWATCFFFFKDLCMSVLPASMSRCTSCVSQVHMKSQEGVRSPGNWNYGHV